MIGSKRGCNLKKMNANNLEMKFAYTKGNILHVILKHYFSGDMFKSLNRPFDLYLEKVGDSLV